MYSFQGSVLDFLNLTATSSGYRKIMLLVAIIILISFLSHIVCIFET